ncbi:MAG: phage tail tape measure protein, partial [Lachnospiraceae bacterium]|nr:phage tail tape measure protein [Lachnospiraceae bacterium]
VTLPIAGVATAAVKTAADFEASMSKVGAISGAVADDEISGIIKKAGEMGLSFKEGADTTETAMNILKAKAQQMGATTAFSASESAQAMQYMAMAGWKTADMMDGIAGIMDLAAASGEELAATSDIVTDGLTAFGMTAKESSRFADVMAATSSNANTNVALMGETFKYCASTAGAMGYSIEDISVAIGIMGNAGIKGSMAGTTLKNTIANLAKPTDSQAEIMKKLGISLTDGSGNMKSFAEVMDNLRSSFSGLSETEKAAAATTLAGKQSMAGLLTIVNASEEDFDKLTAAINGSKGSAGEMAKTQLDNLNGQITLLKSATEGILITIGDKLMPYVKDAVSWIQKAADYINGLSDAQVNNIVKWAGIAAAVGPVVMIFGKIISTVGKAVKTFGTITKTIANFGGIIGVITSPAGIVIGVLAAIAVAAVLIIKNWDKVREFLSGVGSWFKNVFEKAGSSIENFKNKFSSIANSVRS